MQEKGNVKLGMAIVLVVLALVLGYAFAKKTQAPNDSADAPKTGWKEYEGQGFNFDYPENLSVSKDGLYIALSHSVAQQVPNLCDFVGEGPEYLDKLTDLSVSMKLTNKDLTGAIDEDQGSSYITAEFFENNKLKNEEDYYEGGYIMPFTAGSLKGYQLTQGAEGCGRYTYYFPVSEKNTLVVRRAFIPELSVSLDKEKYLTLPNIISPEKETEYFSAMLSSLEIE